MPHFQLNGTGYIYLSLKLQCLKKKIDFKENSKKGMKIAHKVIASSILILALQLASTVHAQIDYNENFTCASSTAGVWLCFLFLISQFFPS